MGPGNSTASRPSRRRHGRVSRSCKLVPQRGKKRSARELATGATAAQLPRAFDHGVFVPRIGPRRRGSERRHVPCSAVTASGVRFQGGRRCWRNTNPNGFSASGRAFRPLPGRIPANRGGRFERIGGPVDIAGASASSWGSMPNFVNPPSVPTTHHRGRSSRQIRLIST